MDGCQHSATITKWHDVTADLVDAERTTGDAPYCGCAERNNDIRPDQLALEIEPPVTAIDFISIWALVQTSLATGFKLEVFHGIGHKNRLAFDTRLFQCFRKHAAGRTDKRFALFVFLISRLLANHHNSCARRSLAGHHLRRMLVKRA